MIEDITISKAGANDQEELKAISIKTFMQTFAGVNTEENMQQYISENLSDEKLMAELNDSDAAFYIARDGQKNVIGYLKLNFNEAQTELQDREAMEIERIYALKEYHGKSLGKLLFQKALTVARELGAKYIWLGVWEENERAIAFYKKNGFVQFDQHSFKLGTDIQTDIMMKRIAG